MSELGIDYSALPDIAWQTKSGMENLAEALARRLQTPRGGLFYDPEYGLDVRDWLNETDSEEARFELSTLASAECEADPRVLSADVEVIALGDDGVTIAISGQSLEGPFSLILEANKVTVEVLNADAG
jgi:phage baseplate assembly protein W